MYPLPAAIEDAFAKADALAVEVDLNHTDMAQMAGFVMQNGMYTAGDTLWDHVSADTKQRLEKFCAANGFPCDLLATMKPWLVSVTIASIPLVKSGMNPELGIDKYFLDKAKDKRVVEIESADSQFKLI